MDRSEIDGRKLTPLQPHGVALVIGSVPYPEGDKRLRWRSLHPKPGRAAKSCEGLTVAEVSSFYNIERADEALKLLTRRTNAQKRGRGKKLPRPLFCHRFESPPSAGGLYKRPDLCYPERGKIIRSEARGKWNPKRKSSPSRC